MGATLAASSAPQSAQMLATPAASSAPQSALEIAKYFGDGVRNFTFQVGPELPGIPRGGVRFGGVSEGGNFP